jgi:hypothetical protein
MKKDKFDGESLCLRRGNLAKDAKRGHFAETSLVRADAHLCPLLSRGWQCR